MCHLYSCSRRRCDPVRPSRLVLALGSGSASVAVVLCLVGIVVGGIGVVIVCGSSFTLLVVLSVPVCFGRVAGAGMPVSLLPWTCFCCTMLALARFCLTSRVTCRRAWGFCSWAGASVFAAGFSLSRAPFQRLRVTRGGSCFQRY